MSGKRTVQPTLGFFMNKTPSPKRKREPSCARVPSETKNRIDSVKRAMLAAPKPRSALAPLPVKRTPSRPPLASTRDSKRQVRSEKFKDANEKRYFWLDPPLDSEKRPPTDPDYDPRSLYIPEAQFLAMKPFEKQYWEIKRQHFDKVVFFTKGKFYELFEMDADIGAKELGLKMTNRVNMRMVGLPKTHFEDWATKLVHLGYKIVKVDQTETKLERDKRVEQRKREGKPPSPEDKMIGRSVSGIFTPGTLTDEAFIGNPYGSYLISIKELSSDQPISLRKKTLQPRGSSYGICYLDASTAEVAVGQFQDDKEATQLETVLLQIKPKEIIFEKGGISRQTMKMFRVAAPHATLSPRVSPQQFWGGMETMVNIEAKEYFGPPEAGRYDHGHWPPVLQQMASASERHELALSALGGCVAYMQELRLDQSVLPLGRVHAYETLAKSATHLVLDGKTLRNLEVFENMETGGSEGSLFSNVNHCVTAFGKRLLRKWLCRPLRQVGDIDARLDSIQNLIDADFTPLRDGMRARLKKLPDLERLLSRAHSLTCSVLQLVQMLEGFQSVWNVLLDMREQSDMVYAPLLQRLVLSHAHLPSLDPPLAEFRALFDWEKAKTDEIIAFFDGLDGEHDSRAARVANVENRLSRELVNAKQAIGASAVKFVTLGKRENLLEVPKQVLASKTVPANWDEVGETKSVKRFWTATIQQLNADLLDARDVLTVYRRGLLNQCLERFAKYRQTWMAAVECVATLDALISLAITSEAPDMCRPSVVENDDPFVDFEELRHPCVKNVDEFIPNDVRLGGETAPAVLLTGPNMGGKSTLLRQVCVAVIMAQVGCFLPASRAVLSPADRIFSRIGANDNIIGGQSTFMVELLETVNILTHATRRSLVILDELGRGTSTFDGYSIAYSVLRHLSSAVKCRLLFSTHYHMLTEEFRGTEDVSQSHMGCLLDESTATVTFLYRLLPGTSASSYGMNVACMAGIKPSIVARAREISRGFSDGINLQNGDFGVEGRSPTISEAPGGDQAARLSAADKETGRLVSDTAGGGMHNYLRLVELWSLVKGSPGQ